MFERWKRKKESLPQVDIIKRWNQTDNTFYAPGALIRVKNGKGLLCEKFSDEYDDKGYSTLMFGDQPLLQFQGDEYFCPTCEKLVRSGYQLEQTEEFFANHLNEEDVAFEILLDELKPLWGLLKDSYYVILDTELYPTDGNGHLFWDVPDTKRQLPGSCLYYAGVGNWGLPRPHFTIATQSASKCRQERVEYYRTHSNARAIAYYMDGYLTALLDGHHKTLAAAMEHRKINALVIMPCYTWQLRQTDGTLQPRLVSGEFSFDCDAYGIDEEASYMGEKISFEKMEAINKRMPDTHSRLPYDADALASYYPTVEEMYCIDECGEISEGRLDDIVAEKVCLDENEIYMLIKALGGLRHKRLFDTVDFFLTRCSYTSLQRFHDTDTILTLVEQLMKLSRTTELEDYFIDIMVEYEEDYPDVGARIQEYL